MSSRPAPGLQVAAVRPSEGGGGTRGWAVVLLGAGLAAAAACGPAPPAGGPPAPAAGAGRAGAQSWPARSGSLGQSQISVQANAGALRIEVTPLDDWVLDAAAPDTRVRLARIRDVHGREAARRSGARDPALFLVSFSSARAGAEFQPEDLHLVARGLRERPLAILAVTPAWGSHRLESQSSAVALYAYDAVDVKRPFVVLYQGVEDGSWADKAPAIEAERSRIIGSGPPPHGSWTRLPGRAARRRAGVPAPRGRTP